MSKNLIAPNNDEQGPASHVETVEELDIKRQEAWSLAVGRFGHDLGEYNRERLIAEVKVYCDQSGRAMLEAGRRLVLLRAREEHGDFLKSLEEIGLPKSTAYRFINAAEKFLDDSGKSKFPALENLGMTKIFSLASLSYEQLKEIEASSDPDGLSKETVKEMTTRELNDKVKELKAENTRLKREAQQDKKINDEMMADKSKKLDDMERKLKTMTDQSRWGEKAEEHLQRIYSIMTRTDEAWNELGEILTDVEGLEVKEWEGSQRILFEQIGHVIEMARDRVEAIGRRTDFLVPTGNSAHHLLTDLRPINVTPKEEPELV